MKAGCCFYGNLFALSPGDEDRALDSVLADGDTLTVWMSGLKEQQRSLCETEERSSEKLRCILAKRGESQK